MEKKVIAISISIVLIIIIITLSGCFENNNELSDELLIKQIKTNSINAINNVTSYKCNVSGILSITIYKGAEKNVSERFSTINLSVNISNHILEQYSEFHTVGDDVVYKTLIYMVDNFKYTGKEIEGNLSWETDEYTSASTESVWRMLSSLELFADQMIDRMPRQDVNIIWKRLKDESIDNQMCYVIKSELITNRTNETYSGYDRGEIYHTFWIDQTNYLLYKVKLEQIYDTSGWYAGGNDRVYLIGEDIFTHYDHNIPINIELPPEIIR